MSKRTKSKPPSKEWSHIKDVKRERLISERKKQGLTQGQLAKMQGVSTSLISHLENGRLNPTIDVALGLQQLFNASHEELFPDF